MKPFKILLTAVLIILSVSVFAQDSIKQKAKTPKQKSEKVIYTCPMHSEVTSDKTGTCSQCGMELTKSKKEQMKMDVMKMYTCPMHPEEKSDKPGKCSKCGMNLKETEKITKVYTCPMHPEVTSDKPGKCSKCNMDLKEKKDDHSNHQH